MIFNWAYTEKSDFLYHICKQEGQRCPKRWVAQAAIRLVTAVIVSTGSIRWILWFSVRYAAATPREIFGVNALRGKQQQLGSPNLQDIFIGKENSLILKNKMAATGISLKIIYIFLLPVPHR